MADNYAQFTHSGLGKFLTKKLGLPRPSHLRRYKPGKALIPGTAVVLGQSSSPVVELLQGWGLEATDRPQPTMGAVGAVVLTLQDIATPGEISDVAMAAAPVVKKLVPGGRVVTISRSVEGASHVEEAAARGAVTGLLRSLARELRGGSTGNGILLAENVDVNAPSTHSALRFFLSGRSAYVDGQFLEVDSSQGSTPDNPEKPLAGKVAAITGAARGIGASIADVMARDGATIIAIDMPAASESLTQVANRNSGTALQLDITSQDAGHRILEHAQSRHQGLDIVVHNAGITRDKLLVNMDASQWESVLAVNLESQLRMNQQFRESGFNNLRIVGLASTSGIAGNRGQTNYAASKAGVMALVATEAHQVSQDGGSINAVAPGFIETEMTATMPLGPRVVGRLLMPSLQQGGLPLDVAEAISFLASDGAGGINGQTLRVCGQSLIGA